MTEATRDSGCPDTREPGSHSSSAGPASGGLSSARGRARRPRSSPPRASPFSMVARAPRERRRAPERGGAAPGAEPREGRERPGRATGDGWGGQLPGAAREDVATAPRCPSAPETPPRRSPEPPCLRRPRPGSGPSPPRCGSPGGRAAAAGEEEAAAAALGYARCPASVGSWGRSGWECCSASGLAGLFGGASSLRGAAWDSPCLSGSLRSRGSSHLSH